MRRKMVISVGLVNWEKHKIFGKWCKRELFFSWRGTQWEFLHEGEACRVQCRGPPGSWNREYKDNDKMLYNRCPLKREGRIRARDEMLYEWVWGTGVYHWKTRKKVQIHIHNWKLCQMIHEAWYGGRHLENDNVNGSRHGRNHPIKRIISKPRYGRSHPIMRRITYDNSWYGHNHPFERNMYINITMSHRFST